MRHRTLLFSSLALAALSACAVNPRPAFDDTKAQVKARSGFDAEWMRTDAEEQAVMARVLDLLKEPLSPRRVAQIALINNRGLQARLENLGIAQADLVAAGLPTNPDVEAFLGWPSEAGGAKRIETGFGLDILSLLVIPSRKNLARLELKQAKAMAGDEILKVAAQAQTEALELQAAQAEGGAIAAAIEIEEVLTEFAEARMKAGNLSALEGETERAHLDGLIADRARLLLGIKQKREALNRTMGLSGDLGSWTMADLENRLPSADPALEGLEKVALDQRFDLSAARAAAELLESTLRLQKKTRLLPAGLRVGVHTEKEGEVRVTGPTVRLQLPVLNPGRAESARLESLYLQSKRLVEDREIRARAEVREKQDQLAVSRALVRHQEEVAGPRRKRILEMTRNYYNMMLKGAPDLLRARLDEVEAERALIEARQSYWAARAALTLALGGSIPGQDEGDKQ